MKNVNRDLTHANISTSEHRIGAANRTGTRKLIGFVKRGAGAANLKIE